MEAQFRIIHSGKEYFDRLVELIDSSQQSIRIFIYTLKNDETGGRIINSLKKASARGVKVYFLADAYGSKELPDHTIDELNELGIAFRLFSPYLTGNVYSLGRRMHMKLVLVDEKQILIGGINFSNSYNDVQGKAWLDYAVTFSSETVGGQLNKIHQMVYDKQVRRKVYETYPLEGKNFRVLINDWLMQTSSIQKVYEEMVDNSSDEVIIMVSYFVPGFRFLRRLANARKRGVKVSVINSRKWDIPFMRHAIRYLYPWMERNGITLYEWQPSVLHAKVMLVDQKMCSLGSFNLNGLSRYNSLEMNVLIREQSFVQQLRSELEKLVMDKNQIARIDHYQPNWLQRFVNWISYRIVRISLSMLLFLVREERNCRSRETTLNSF